MRSPSVIMPSTTKSGRVIVVLRLGGIVGYGLQSGRSTERTAPIGMTAALAAASATWIPSAVMRDAQIARSPRSSSRSFSEAQRSG